jgi:hypothetical protein
MIPGTILLVEKNILAITVTDECFKGCEYAISGNELPASEKKGLTIIFLSAYEEIRAFIPPCLFDNLLNQDKVNDFLWQCWREHSDIFKQAPFNIPEVLNFPIRQLAGDLAYDVLWIHRYLNFLRDFTKVSPVPSWTGEKNELIKWLENQKWEIPPEKMKGELNELS